MRIQAIRSLVLGGILLILSGLPRWLVLPPALAQGEYGLTVTMHQHMVPAGHTARIDYAVGQTDRAFDLVLVSSAGSTPVADCGVSSAARTCRYTHTVNPPGATVYYKAVLEQNGSPIAQSLVDAVSWGTVQLTALQGSTRRLTQGATLFASLTPARLEAHHYLAIDELAGGSQTRRHLKACTSNVDYGRNGTQTTCRVQVHSPRHPGVHRYQAVVIGPVTEYPDGIALRSKDQVIRWGTPAPATATLTPPVGKSQPLSLHFDRLVVQTAAGVVRTSFRVNQPLSIVARYTVQHLQQSYRKGTIRRVFQIPGKGHFTTASVSEDTIVAVNGPNPPNVHSFTPQLTGPIRIIVGIRLGALLRQRRVDIRITR